jgi:hypothetical protein
MVGQSQMTGLVLVAITVLIAIATQRYKRGKELEHLRQLHGVPPPPRFSRKDVPRYKPFVQICKVSAVIAILTIPAWLLTAGPHPRVNTWSPVKAIIDFLSFNSFVVFVCSGGLLLQFWLIERYGDPPR